MGECECRSFGLLLLLFVGDAFPSLFGELTFAELISGATVAAAVAVVVAAAAVVAAAVEVVPTIAVGGDDDDDVIVVVDVDGAVVKSVLFESRPTLSMLPFLNIPCSSVIFAHFVGGNAFNLRNR